MLSAFQPIENKDSLPDPDVSMFKLRGASILVRPVEVEDKIGSIIIAQQNVDTYQQLMGVAKVLAVSPVAHDPAIQGPDPIEVGDYVMYEKHALEKRFPLGEDSVVVGILSADVVKSTVTDPKHLKMHNLRMKG